jgi:hypothetical protein
VTEAEAMMLTDETARNIISHNEFGEKKCGWQPPKRK